jgi:hypothetical protein
MTSKNITLKIKANGAYCSEKCPLWTYDGEFDEGCCRIDLTFLYKDNRGYKRTRLCTNGEKRYLKESAP